MSYNWSVVTDKIYGIIKGSCKKLTMYDAAGNETIDPDDATRFFGIFASHDSKLDNFTILVALHDRGQTSYINIKTPQLKDDIDFKKVHQIRNHIRKSVGQREGIKVAWQVFDKEIDPKEEAVNNIKESKDVSKWFGTTKSSFQRIGEAKLIIRHTDAINENKPGARTRHIRALFVENKTGERFSYPHLHMSGARAFARHISNGGTNFDAIAEGIISLSADYISLRHAAHTMRQHQVISEWIVSVRESMDGINRRLKSLHGPKGYANAESILASQSMVLDEQSTDSLWQKLSEECSCGQHDPAYADLGVAAKYLGAVDNQPKPITFSWHRKPDISGAPDNREVLERLHWQISELADACADPRASARLSEIAGMIASNIKPTEEDLNLVREAIASSSIQPKETVLPEEAELESFLNEFAPEAIFSSIDEDKDEKKDDKISCSNCGEEFKANGRKHGFSHCKDHKGFKLVSETMSLTDEMDEGYKILRPIDSEKYQARAGLEGPFQTKIGKVVYYDPKEGKYYDPDSDFYIDHDDYAAMNVDEGDAYGIAQKERERKEEIAYNKEQRAKRWNFGKPLPDETSADSDLEEAGSNNEPCNVCDGSGTHRGKTCRLCDGSGLSSSGHHNVKEDESDIRFIPGIPGEALEKVGDYYLVWDKDRYEAGTVKHEYDVYQKIGDTFKHIENLDMPYVPPGRAIKVFIEKYSHMTESENIKRIKHLAGI